MNDDIRTIVSKTRQVIIESKEMLKNKDEEKQMQFFSDFVRNDIGEVERELFPIADLHMGEINPTLARRIFNQKLSQYGSSNLNKSFDGSTRGAASRTYNPWLKSG